MTMNQEWMDIFFRDGYRLFRTESGETAVFYKYYEEGFHVILAVEVRGGYPLPEEEIRGMRERVQGMFYHPQGILPDFPDGFPVYHVELLTVFYAKDMEAARRLCTRCSNAWIYDAAEKRLIVYEDQPGDFWGLRRKIEQAGTAQGKGGRPEGKRMSFPYVTGAITAVNVLAYVILSLGGSTESGAYMAQNGAMYPDFLTYGHQWWRILTAMFVHFGVTHLANNMVIFCCVGSRLEKAIGHWKMLVVYLLSGVGGGLLSYAVMMFTGDYAVSGGASGAVFGVIGGLLWVVIYHKGRLEGMTIRGMVLMLVLSLYFGFTTAGVDNRCHVGGMICGFFSALILYHRKRQKY